MREYDIYVIPDLGSICKNPSSMDQICDGLEKAARNMGEVESGVSCGIPYFCIKIESSSIREAADEAMRKVTEKTGARPVFVFEDLQGAL